MQVEAAREKSVVDGVFRIFSIAEDHASDRQKASVRDDEHLFEFGSTQRGCLFYGIGAGAVA